MGAADYGEIQVPILPVGDLKILTQLSRNLMIPTDVLPTLAILSGLSEAGPKVVSITPGGAVRVAETGAGFSSIEPHEGTITNNSVTIDFTNLISSLLINIDAYQCTVQHSEDGQIFDNAITVLAGEKVSIDVLTRAIKITNTSATTATGYRVWGLYY